MGLSQGASVYKEMRIFDITDDTLVPYGTETPQMVSGWLPF